METTGPGADRHFVHLIESIAQLKPQSAFAFRVADLIALVPEAGLCVLGSHSGLERRVNTPYVQAFGLAVCGFPQNVEKGSLQLLGMAELCFLRGLQGQAKTERQDALALLESLHVGAFLIPDNEEPPLFFLEWAQELQVSVLNSPLSLKELSNCLSGALFDKLTAPVSFHGGLVSVNGVGTLILGNSGAGKSDCALELVSRGGQLVADDMVQVCKNRQGNLVGKAKGLTQCHLDICGVGIVDIERLFGVASVLPFCDISLAIYLDSCRALHQGYFQDTAKLELLGVSLPLHRLPISPVRDRVVLIQMLIRNYILKQKGEDREAVIADKLNRMLDVKWMSYGGCFFQIFHLIGMRELLMLDYLAK